MNTSEIFSALFIWTMVSGFIFSVFVIDDELKELEKWSWGQKIVVAIPLLPGIVATVIVCSLTAIVIVVCERIWAFLGRIW